jgi:hypothetical protein
MVEHPGTTAQDVLLVIKPDLYGMVNPLLKISISFGERLSENARRGKGQKRQNQNKIKSKQYVHDKKKELGWLAGLCYPGLVPAKLHSNTEKQHL